MKHLLSALRAVFLFPSAVADWHRHGRAEWSARVAQGYCSACGEERAEPGYKTCAGCYAIGVE